MRAPFTEDGAFCQVGTMINVAGPARWVNRPSSGYRASGRLRIC
ncbi:hypothetical protein BH160DRAFT_5855 [Burkholderia sp. H160]|nr:hypothetical protein BH160DRAFT_5855 [Burkholderia sp. H160]